MPATAEKLGADFNFANEQQQAESAFAACGGSPRHPAADKVYLLEEAGRPGQLMPIMEDEHGTYIMNSKDLRAVEHVARLARMGIDSLKVEGRTKSQYYVTRTAQIYRRAIDDAVAGRPFNPELIAPAGQPVQPGLTPAAFWSAAPCRTTRATKPGTRISVTATLLARYARWQTAGLRWMSRTWPRSLGNNHHPVGHQQFAGGAQRLTLHFGELFIQPLACAFTVQHLLGADFDAHGGRSLKVTLIWLRMVYSCWHNDKTK
jgi:hypothetical protein